MNIFHVISWNIVDIAYICIHIYLYISFFLIKDMMQCFLRNSKFKKFKDTYVTFLSVCVTKGSCIYIHIFIKWMIWNFKHRHFFPITLSSSVHGIYQAKILEWVAIFFSRGFSWLRDYKGFHCSSVGKESACKAEDLDLIPRSGRLPGEEYLQYSCLENPMVRGSWWATVHAVARVGHDLVTKPPPPPPALQVGSSPSEPRGNPYNII